VLLEVAVHEHVLGVGVTVIEPVAPAADANTDVELIVK
jgi:hypothetical protein